MTEISFLRVTVPAPCDWINANQRLHWAEKARRTKAWREAAFCAAHRRGTFTQPVRIVCTVHKTRAGRWDATNLAPTGKALIDGLVDAGVLVDDDNTRVIGPDMRAGDKSVAAHVVITVEAVDA